MMAKHLGYVGRLSDELLVGCVIWDLQRQGGVPNLEYIVDWMQVRKIGDRARAERGIAELKRKGYLAIQPYELPRGAVIEKLTITEDAAEEVIDDIYRRVAMEVADIPRRSKVFLAQAKNSEIEGMSRERYKMLTGTGAVLPFVQLVYAHTLGDNEPALIHVYNDGRDDKRYIILIDQEDVWEPYTVAPIPIPEDVPIEETTKWLAEHPPLDVLPGSIVAYQKALAEVSWRLNNPSKVPIEPPKEISA